MKIVHVMNWYIPNMGYQENLLPAEQKKLGYDVEIITSDRAPFYKSYDRNISRIIGQRVLGTGAFEENNVGIYRLPTIIEIENGGQIILKGLKRKLRELQPDIVQAHGAFTPLTLQVILYSKKIGYKVFVDDHLHESYFNLDSLPKKVFMEMAKDFYRIFGTRVRCWMPVVHSSKQMLQSLLNIPDEKIEMLPLGADTNRFKKSTALRKIGRDTSGITEDDFLIISSGKFGEAKELPFLINAFKKVAETRPKTMLLLVGNGPDNYMKMIKDLVSSAGLKGKIIFKDFASNSELPSYYNAADMGIWSGRPSITVIEAVATGLPVAVPHDDLAYKVLFENGAAIGFNREDINSLSETILELMVNRELYSEIASNALTLASNTLSWKKIAEKSISIYSAF